MSRRALLLVAVALLHRGRAGSRRRIQAGLPADHAGGPRDLRRPLEDSGDRRVHDAQTEAGVPRRDRGTHRGAQHLLARCDGAALAYPGAARPRWEGHRLLAALGNADRRARTARAPGRHRTARAHPAGEPHFVGRPSPGRLEVVSTYTILGIEHILSAASITCCSCSPSCSWFRGRGDSSSPSRRSPPRTA